MDSTGEIPFGPLGYVTHARTYARPLEGGGIETFQQTIERVVKSANRDLGCNFSDDEIRDVTTRFLKLQGTVAGRFLWQLGTDTVKEHGFMSLMNCAAAALSHRPIRFLTWIYDILMLGVGVGYRITDDCVDAVEPVVHCRVVALHEPVDHATGWCPEKKRHMLLPCLNDPANYQEVGFSGMDNYYRDIKTGRFVLLVEDSREGWVSLLRVLMCYHFPEDASTYGHTNFAQCYNKDGVFCFNTICVRPAGEPIKRFGGVSSGHEMMVAGMISINRIFNSYVGEKLPVVAWLDVCNNVASIVVSGNVRRSAQLALGTSDNIEFIEAKQWSKPGGIPSTRGMSNNSLDCKRIGALPREFLETLMGNGGEVPGLVNIDLCRKNGRIGADAPEKSDPDVVCVNPCVAGNTLVQTEVGLVPISMLAAGDEYWPTKLVSFPRSIIVNGYVFDIKKDSVVLTKRQADTVKVSTNEGYSLVCTPDHEIMSTRPLIDMLADSDPLASVCVDWPKMRPASELLPGDKLVLNRQPPGMVLTRPMFPGYTHLEGIDKTADAIMACGYALGHLIGDGVVLNCRAQFRMYLHGERQDTTVLEPCKLEIEKSGFLGNGWHDSWENDDSGPKFSFAYSTPFYNKVCVPLGIFQGTKHVTPAILGTWNEFQRGVIAGLFDTDGSASLATNHVTISQEHRKTLELVQQMLLPLGIVCAISQTHANDFVRRPCYDLRLRPEHIGRFLDVIPVRHARKLETLRKIHEQRCSADTNKVGEPSTHQDAALHRVTVKSVDPVVAKQDVYDMTVKGLHLFSGNGIMVKNCGEQSLCDFETCCLAEVFLPNCNTKDDLWQIVRYLYVICKHALALPCHWKCTEEIVHKNMRMGIGITGYLQATKEQRSWLPDVSKRLDDFDVEYSAKHGWPRSIKLTTVKPSGSISLIAGVTAGCHAAPFPFYLKRMRMAAGSELAREAVARGYYVEPLEKIDYDEDTGQMIITHDDRTVVVDFPCTHGADVPVASSLSACQQMDINRELQRNWSDNNVSQTVTYRPDEVPEIMTYLRKHWEKELKCVSFLLHNDHGFRQAPWTQISEDEYQRRVSLITRPFGCAEDTLSQKLETLTTDELVEEQECAGGSCPRR